MLVEMDQVAIDRALWVRVLQNAPGAREEARTTVDGLVLYMHALSCAENEIIVTLRELEAYDIVDAVTVTQGKGL